jgi:hypothetical protein
MFERLMSAYLQVSVMNTEILVKQVSVIGYCRPIGYLPQTNLVLEIFYWVPGVIGLYGYQL